LERVGELAVEIAERAAHGTGLPAPVPEEVAQMAAAAAGTIRLALEVYEGRNPALVVRRAAQVRAEVTTLAGALTEWLTGAMRADPAMVEPGLNLFAVVQRLWRIGDHTSNLAEEVVLLTDGETPPPTEGYGSGHERTEPRAPRFAIERGGCDGPEGREHDLPVGERALLIASAVIDPP
jgi:phosphate uptake regulator